MLRRYRDLFALVSCTDALCVKKYEQHEGSGHARLAQSIVKLDKIGRNLTRARTRVDDTTGHPNDIFDRLNTFVENQSLIKTTTDPKLETDTNELKERATKMSAQLVALMAMPQMRVL